MHAADHTDDHATVPHLEPKIDPQTDPRTDPRNQPRADHLSSVVELDWFTRRIMNPLVRRLTRWGLSVKGTRVLEVRGRTTGEPRQTVVNLLTLDHERYLVAPRGTTQWVQNLRAAGSGTLRVGRRIESFTATEVADPDKIDVLRAYLDEWAWEVGTFFGDLRADSPDADLAAAASRFPVFRLSTT